ncbi:MAG: hypothetical protein IPK60_14100 [Sandaracinaceae bacterium]|nr:hypothetical protein [Sandaracinaceae bacterium]
MLRNTLLFAAICAFSALYGCSPQIGDDCTSSIRCDLNNTRICDLSLPEGYCTIANCEATSCPQDESLCIEFFSEEPRRAQSYCMARCEVDSDCRDDVGYRCLSASDLDAVSLDEDVKFCALPRATTP